MAGNALGRSYMLAKMLQPEYDIEIIGPLIGNRLWKPVSDDKTIVYKYIPLSHRFKSLFQLIKVLKMIDGDIVYVSKPMLTSLGIGIIYKIIKGKKLIIDIDDWQFGFVKDRIQSYSNIAMLRYLRDSIYYYYHSTAYWNSYIGEKLIFAADKITVSGRFLKEKFGGHIIPHCRNESVFNPDIIDGLQLRRKYGIHDNSIVIMFSGTFRPHKGIEMLIEAISLLKNKNIILMLLGKGNDNYSLKIHNLASSILKNRYISLGITDFNDTAKFISMSDMIIIPQRKTYASMGQTPAKLTDAMAMEKPVITSDNANIRDMLGDNGYYIDSDNALSIADSISYIVDNMEEARKKAANARQIFLEHYSYKCYSSILQKIIEDIYSAH